jgi:hypothetical protein
MMMFISMFALGLLTPTALGGQQGAQAGIPEGWAGFPVAYIGTHIHPTEHDGVRIDALPKGTKPGRVCMKDRSPVSGRVRIKGEWKRNGLIADAGWKGAAITLKFFDQNNKFVKPEFRGQYLVKAGNGTTGWESFTKGFIVPSGAKSAKLCTEIRGSFKGSAEFANIEITGTAAKAKGNGNNVIFIVMDTLRADVLGAYGSRSKLTPHLDAFARNSLVVDRAWTQYTWTTPSFVSYMTSQYARTHGWTYYMGEGSELFHLEDSVPTLAEVLAKQGYITTGVSVNGRVDAKVSMDRGFEKWTGPSPDSMAVKRVLEDMDLWATDGAPNFLYAHFMSTHTPLSPSVEGQKVAGVSVSVPKGGILYYKDSVNREPTEAKHQAMFRQAYMATVFDADRVIHSVIQGLEDRGLMDDTMVVVFSDHGELLGEHGLNGHGPHVYEQLTWIPLIVRASWMSKGRLKDRVAGLIDLAPSVLHALDLEHETPAGWQGESLYKAPTREITVSERGTQMAFIQDGQYKTIEDGGRGMGFDVLADPAEGFDLSLDHKNIVPLHAAAVQWRLDYPQGTNDGPLLMLTTQEKSDEMEKLKALGYVE